MPHPFTENASLNPMKGEIDMDDSNIHIVKRTDQWKERAVQSYVVPRGVLCVELTPDGNTRIKIGEGNKYYSQLPYIGANIDISKYFTKEEVKKLVEDTSEATVVAYMDKQPYVRVLGPILPSASALPKTGNKDGDIRFVKMAKVTPDGKAYIEYVWFNNRWDPLSSAIDIDVSKFATKEELAAVQKTANELAKRVTLLEQAKHIHLNKSIIDSITAPFTTELAAKLAGIEPNANKYVLPIATRHSLGGIIIGEGLLIDSNGRVSVDTSGIIVPPYDDTEVKRRITNLENVAHTHDNKSILDATTASYTTTEKSKLAGLENYDDTEIRQDISDLQSQAHTHANKSILDQTTAPYTTEEQTKLAGLENYTLPVASSDTLGGVKVGEGLTIDADGVLSASGGGSSGGGNYDAGDAIEFRDSAVDVPITNIRFFATGKRAGDNYFQMSELEFYDTSDNLITFSDVAAYIGETSSTPNYPVASENVAKLFDGNTTTKMCCYWSDAGIRVDMTLTSAIMSDLLKSYRYCTGNDFPSRDPVSWTVLASSDNGATWFTIDTRSNATVPSTRNAYTNSFSVSVIKRTINVKYGDGLSLDQNGALTVIGGGSGDYRAGDGIEIVEQTEPSVVEIDISDGWVNRVVTASGSRNAMDDSKTYMRFRYPCTPGQKFKLRFTPSNANDVVYFNVFGFSSDQESSGGQRMYPPNGDFSTDQTAEITVLDGYPSVDFTIRLNNPGWGQGSNITAASFSEMVMIVQEDVPVGEKYINVTPATTTDIGGVKVGDGLSITSDGTLSANAGVEYVAGDGISIDQGSTESSDITELQWEQGSINPVNGEPDDFTTTVIRSPMIEVGLTNMLNVSAQDTSDNDMRWEAAFYDSNSEFISMITTWQTLSDEVIRPDNTKYVVILLRKETETEIDENALKACEISWPIEIGKYVVTNTGVTHVGLTDNGSVIYVENGSTNTLLTFGQDLDVTNGVVSIPDYHRLVLNVEE